MPSLDKLTLNADESEVTVNVAVTNTGKRTGTEVVQLYIRDVVASISRPMKELKGFEKITLKPGETKTVNFKITKELLQFYNSNLVLIAEPGMFEVFIGGNAVDVQKIDLELEE